MPPALGAPYGPPGDGGGGVRRERSRPEGTKGFPSGGRRQCKRGGWGSSSGRGQGCGVVDDGRLRLWSGQRRQCGRK